jgi:hypothetical protein
MYYYDYDSFDTDADYGYRFEVSLNRLYQSYELLYEVLKNPILRKAPGFVKECMAGCDLSYRRCMLSATTPAEQMFCRRIFQRCNKICYQKFGSGVNKL